MLRKKKPNITKNATVTTALPTLKRRSPNRVRGSIGCSVWRSQRRKPVSATTATIAAAITGVVVQPFSPPWMIVNTSAPRPARDSTAPTGSSGVSDSSRDSGAKVQIAMNVAATSGRLTSTAEPHQYRSSSAPETIGPMAPPAPAKPAHTPIARFRSSGGKIVVMIESVAGITSAAPMPITALAGDDLTCTRCHAGDERSRPEHHQTSEQRALATESVAERTRGQQRPGEHDGVRVEDPCDL